MPVEPTSATHTQGCIRFANLPWALLCRPVGAENKQTDGRSTGSHGLIPIPVNANTKPKPNGTTVNSQRFATVTISASSGHLPTITFTDVPMAIGSGAPCLKTMAFGLPCHSNSTLGMNITPPSTLGSETWAMTRPFTTLPPFLRHQDHSSATPKAAHRQPTGTKHVEAAFIFRRRFPQQPPSQLTPSSSPPAASPSVPGSSCPQLR